MMSGECDKKGHLFLKITEYMAESQGGRDGNGFSSLFYPLTLLVAPRIAKIIPFTKMPYLHMFSIYISIMLQIL